MPGHSMRNYDISHFEGDGHHHDKPSTLADTSILGNSGSGSGGHGHRSGLSEESPTFTTSNATMVDLVARGN